MEDCCGGGPTMSGGDAMYTSDAPAEGPFAGYDPMLGKKKKKKGIVDTAKRLRKEEKKPLPDLRMMMKAGNLETRDEKNRSKAFRNVERARKIQKFLSQPFHVAEQFTGIPGVLVDIKDTIKGFNMIMDGELDKYPEAAFNLKGSIQEAIDAGEKMLAEA